MNFRIEEKDEFKVVGIKKWFSTVNNNQMKQIPKMWDNLSKEICEVLQTLNENGEFVGLCADMYNEGFDYWIGTITHKACPDNMCERVIPKSTWAIFEIVGPMRPLPNAMQDVWGRIYSEWFPSSGYKHAEIPEIEFYTKGDNTALDYKSEIWIPVVKE